MLAEDKKVSDVVLKTSVSKNIVKVKKIREGL